MYRTIAAAVITACGLVTAVHAGVPVEVVINGEVDFNQVSPANSRLGNAAPGDPVVISFLLDSNDFNDNMSFPHPSVSHRPIVIFPDARPRNRRTRKPLHIRVHRPLIHFAKRRPSR